MGHVLRERKLLLRFWEQNKSNRRSFREFPNHFGVFSRIFWDLYLNDRQRRYRLLKVSLDDTWYNIKFHWKSTVRKWLLTLLHTWHHNGEIQWVTKGTHNTATGRLWVQVLSLFPRLQSCMYCCFNYCYIYPSRCLLPLHWFSLFKIKLIFQRNIKKVENQ